MKNIFFCLSILCVYTANSQTLNLDGMISPFVDGAYYKDIDNYYDPYIGTWKYVNGGTEMTTTFKRVLKYNNGKFYLDILVGDMRYVKDGIVLIDKLSRITEGPQANPKLHDLFGDFLLKPTNYPKCPECPANERRVSMIFYGRNNNEQGGEIVLQRITTPGQPDTIKLTIKYLLEIDIEGEPAPLPPKIEGIEFILTKQ